MIDPRFRPAPDRATRRGEELQAPGEFEKHADQRVSLTDRLSFVVMNQLGIRDVFGFDPDFRLAGFRRWPADG